jgi:hypothetical protein
LFASLWTKFDFERGIFQIILAYTQDDLHPSYTGSFVEDLAVKGFVYSRWSLEPILRDRQELGAHTGVLEFSAGRVRTFLWSHPIKRPLGQAAASQCPDCGRLKPWNVKINQDHSNIILQCSYCTKTSEYQLPANATWPFKPPARNDERGAWLCITEKAEVQESEDLAETRDVEMMD